MAGRGGVVWSAGAFVGRLGAIRVLMLCCVRCRGAWSTGSVARVALTLLTLSPPPTPHPFRLLIRVRIHLLRHALSTR